MEPDRCKSHARAAAVAGMFAFVAASGVGAQPVENDIAAFSLTPFAGYTFGGEFKDAQGSQAVDVDDAAHFGLVFNIRESDHTQWEVFYSRQQSDADTTDILSSQPSVDLDIQYLQIGGTYVADGARARPFLAATVGGTRFDPEPLTFDSENFLSFGVGAGWYLRAAERLNLRLEGRLLGTFLRANTGLFCETGPDENVCAIAADSDMFWQFQASLGFAFRF